MKRILTAIVALPVVLALNEFYHIAAKADARPFQVFGYVVALAVVACFVLKSPQWIVACIAALTIISLSAEVFRERDMSAALASVSATVFGVVYVALLAGFLIGVRMLPDDFAPKPAPHLASKLLTMFFAMVMMTDTGAYYTGRSIGRHKLAPRVSPGKTIEGSIGGLITAIIAGPVCKLTFFPEIPMLDAAALGGVIGIVGQVGDLAESLLKRGAGVKDSGRLLPGHGGMLDRVDSLLFCAPLLYYYAVLFVPKW
jgi:phosphatidate cytidylyltransferase